MPMYKLDDFYKDLTILVHDSGFVQAGGGAMKATVGKEVKNCLDILDKVASFITRPDFPLNLVDVLEVQPEARRVAQKTIPECFDIIKANLQKAVQKGWIDLKDQPRIDRAFQKISDQLPEKTENTSRTKPKMR
jgi:hypothetical protein